MGAQPVDGVSKPFSPQLCCSPSPMLACSLWLLLPLHSSSSSLLLVVLLPSSFPKPFLAQKFCIQFVISAVTCFNPMGTKSGNACVCLIDHQWSPDWVVPSKVLNSATDWQACQQPSPPSSGVSVLFLPFPTAHGAVDRTTTLSQK